MRVVLFDVNIGGSVQVLLDVEVLTFNELLGHSCGNFDQITLAVAACVAALTGVEATVLAKTIA